ncbi:unnamed protein product [Prorocentrum cordatum]|uniref:Uncharacterized protein n=1 Tax=Prorocentrum cordatum TaxID=2364126 RepID=A0ABN9Q1G1_9DINO|nr:unnamed protein product [Polarella glacialis]
MDLLLWSDHVHLRKVGNNKWMLRSIETYEFHEFEAEAAELVHSDDNASIAVVKVDGSADVIGLDNLFKWRLYRAKGSWGYFAKATVVYPTHTKTIQKSVDDMFSDHRKGKVNVAVGSGNGETQFKVFIFKRHRQGGQRIWWDHMSLHKYLKIKSYKGIPSRWWGRVGHKWDGSFLQNFGFGSMIYGKVVAPHAVKKMMLPFRTRCLDSSSLSTAGLVFAVARCAYLSPEAGGFKEESSTRAATELMDAFIGTFLRNCQVEGKAPAITLYLVADWAPPWPFPTETGTPQVNLGVHRDGIDVKPLHSLANASGRTSIVTKYFRMVESVVGSSDQGVMLVSWENLFSNTVSKRSSKFFSQIVYGLAMAAEALVLRGVTNKDVVDTLSPINVCTSTMQDMDRHEVDYFLAKYVACAKDTFKSPMFLNVAIDKDGAPPASGNPGNLPLYGSVFTLPSGVAVVGPPQVASGAGALEWASGKDIRSARPGGKKSENTDGDAGTMRANCHRAWLQRGRHQKGQSWRPAVLHRAAAASWCTALDNAMKHVTETDGLSYLRPDASDKWHDANWRNWPHMSLPMDLGPDGMAGCNALLYKWKLNLTRIDEFSHGSNNDLKVYLKEIGMWDLAILLFIHFNVPFGPGKEGDRYRHLERVDTMRKIYDEETYRSVPCFQHYCNNIVQEMKRDGYEFTGDEPDAAVAWNFMKEENGFIPLGMRLNFCRCCDAADGFDRNYKYWWRHTFERACVALEHDMLANAKLQKVAVKQAEVDGAIVEGGGTTSSAKVTIDAKVLRSANANAVAISVLLTSCPRNRRTVACSFAPMHVVKKWQGKSAKEMKTAEATQVWMTNQIRGDFMDHVISIVNGLMDAHSMESCDSILNMRAIKDADPGEVGVEDDFAELHGMAHLSLAAARMRRCLFLFGWPLKMQRALADPETGLNTAREFKRDIDVFNEYCAYKGDQSARCVVVKRSVFGLTATKQITLAFRELGFNFPHQAIKDIMKGRSTGITNTIPVEKIIGAQKKCSRFKACKKFRGPATAMHTAICCGVIDEQLKFTALEADTPLQDKTASLPPEAFKPVKRSASIAFGDIVSTAQKTDYYSPGPTLANTPVADLKMVSDAKAKGGFGHVTDAWLGGTFKLKHKFVFSSPHHGGDAWWHLALYHWPTSGVLCWPGKLVTVEGSPNFYFEFALDLQEPVHVGVFDWADFKVREISFKSWAWQGRNMPQGWVDANKPGARVFATGSVTNIQKLAATNCFWNISSSDLGSIASYLKIPIPEGASLFSKLHTMICSLLGITSEAAMKFLCVRWSCDENDLEFAQELMEVEAAIEVLDQHDHDTAKQQIHAAETSVKAHEEFTEEFEAKLLELARAKAGGKKPKVGAGKTEKIPTTLTQKEAKKYLPPGASIWRGFSRGEWMGHMPPYRRVSAPWSKHTEAGAMRVVLKKVWIQYLAKEVKDRSHCPWPELFE